jgi:branched-chain amino acid transport system substrate-binding protein
MAGACDDRHGATKAREKPGAKVRLLEPGRFAMLRISATTFIALAALAAAGAPASADMKVGITISATGPGAALGTPEMKTVPVLPSEIAGQKVQYFPLDDASDATKSATNVRKFVTEDKVDVLMGSTLTFTTLPLIDIAAESKTPLLATTAGSVLVDPVDEKRKWVFKVVPNDRIGALALARYMAKQGIKTVGFLAFNDAYGEAWTKEVNKAFPDNGMKIVASETYARTDTSTTAQTLKLIAANPDAIFIAASGTPATVPARELREHGYKGPMFQTHGVASPAFIQAGGKDVEGTVISAEPFVVASQLPDDSPFKKVGLDYVAKYKEVNGTPPAIFGAHLVDGMSIVAAAMPEALKKGAPGTEAFRVALRDAMEQVKGLYLNNGLLTMTPTDHCGYQESSALIMKVENGAFKLIQ